MVKVSKNALKPRFETGKKPLQSDFENWMDSYWHKEEVITLDHIENLQPYFDQKADKQELEYLWGLKRVVTGVHSYQELINYPKTDLVIGDSIIVGNDETREGDATIYIWEESRVWKYLFSLKRGKAEDSLKASDEVFEYGIPQAALEENYGDKPVGFEVWCTKACIKYTKYSEYIDESGERVSLWHRFNYKKYIEDPTEPEPQPNSAITSTSTDMAIRSLTTHNGKLYGAGSHLFVFDGTTWEQRASISSYPYAIAVHKGNVYYGSSLGLYREREGITERIVCYHPSGVELGDTATDFWSLCSNGEDFFAGAGENCDLGVYYMIVNNAGYDTMFTTNLGWYGRNPEKPESYWVIKSEDTVWAGSLALPEGKGKENAGLYYWDPVQRIFAGTNLESGNYKDVVDFNGYYYALGESGEGIFKSPAGDYHSFKQVATGYSFHKGAVIDNRVFLCSSEGLYIMDADDTIRHIADVGDTSGLSSTGDLFVRCEDVIQFKGYIFVCHWNGVYAMNIQNNKIEYVIVLPGAISERIIEYNGKLYAGFLSNTGMHVIEVVEEELRAKS